MAYVDPNMTQEEIEYEQELQRRSDEYGMENADENNEEEQ